MIDTTSRHDAACLPATGAHEKNALETAAAIRVGTTTAVAETDAAIARIEARDAALNAVVVRDFERAGKAAAEVDRKRAAGFDGTLLGVPMTVKESFDVAGLPTTFGFEEHRGFVAQADALAVRKPKEAGAVILGKTNVPPGLADLQSNNPVYGRTLNAVDPARSAGGSSGGSAVAVASGMVPLEFGSDIGGSIRVPAMFNGVWGHKPTWGVLPTDGHFFPGTDGGPGVLSVIGPIARDADDLGVALDLVARHPLAPAPDREAGDWRILVIERHPLGPIQSAIVEAVRSVASAFEAAGATVDRESDLLPDLERQHADYWALLNIAMARGAPDADGKRPTLGQWMALHDKQARNQRAWARLFEHYDAVIAPVLGTTAFAHDDEPLATRMLSIDGAATQFFHQFAYPGIATFPLLPATSVRVGTDPDGLPIGVQVIADAYRDHTAIAVARAAQSLVIQSFVTQSSFTE